MLAIAIASRMAEEQTQLHSSSAWDRAPAVCGHPVVVYRACHPRLITQDGVAVLIKEILCLGTCRPGRQGYSSHRVWHIDFEHVIIAQLKPPTSGSTFVGTTRLYDVISPMLDCILCAISPHSRVAIEVVLWQTTQSATTFCCLHTAKFFTTSLES